MLVDKIIRKRWWLFGLIFLGGLISFFQGWRIWREDSQDKHILAAARKYRMDPALVKAVVWRESKFDPRVKGRAGEVGLMQIREAAASEWAKAEMKILFEHRQLFDPARNTEAGTWYLRKLMGRYLHTDNPAAYALADYNAGRSRVLRWNKGAAETNSAAFLVQIEFPRTRDYVRSVLERQQKYQREFAAAAARQK